MVWTADQRDAAGRPVRDPGSVSHSAAIESAAWAPGHPDRTPMFAQRVERDLTRRGFFQARQQVFLGDGARWIWNLASLLAPEALQIVDGYHAQEHLSALAATLFGPQTDAAQQWARARHAELDADDLDAVLAALRPFVTAAGDRRAGAATEYGYFHTNRERMDYARFRALGLSVGSGVVEAGCRVLVGQRLKRSGMFWSEPGANAILALRSALLSRRFDDFWSRRLAHRHSNAA